MSRDDLNPARFNMNERRKTSDLQDQDAENVLDAHSATNGFQDDDGALYIMIPPVPEYPHSESSPVSTN